MHACKTSQSHRPPLKVGLILFCFYYHNPDASGSKVAICKKKLAGDFSAQTKLYHRQQFVTYNLMAN